MHEVNLTFFRLINGFAGRFGLLDYLGVFVADYLGYFLVIAAVFLFFKEKDFSRRFYFFAFVSLSLILSRGIITESLRFFYPVDRPSAAGAAVSVLINHAATPAFPSGHAAFYFALASAVFFLNRKWGGWFLAGAFLIGLARVFAGVHWPLDILAGAFVGLASVLAVKKILSYSYGD